LIPESYHPSILPECGEDNTHDEPPPDIEQLGATLLNHLLASEELVGAFAIQLGECQGLLAVLLECITKGE